MNCPRILGSAGTQGLLPAHLLSIQQLTVNLVNVEALEQSKGVLFQR